ncbi:hypothetical protein T484DRAFT_1821211 [Baffinella frigidus]|nr:hypothetical protein T484DRAFT_1821211 [Cryptophyta sp. CCMP2293]
MTSRMVAALLAALLAAVTTAGAADAEASAAPSGWGQAAAAGAEASAPPSESPKIPSKPAVGRLRLSPEGHFAAPPSLDPKVGGGSMQGLNLKLGSSMHGPTSNLIREQVFFF